MYRDHIHSDPRRHPDRYACIHSKTKKNRQETNPKTLQLALVWSRALCLPVWICLIRVREVYSQRDRLVVQYLPSLAALCFYVTSLTSPLQLCSCTFLEEDTLVHVAAACRTCVRIGLLVHAVNACVSSLVRNQSNVAEESFKIWNTETFPMNAKPKWESSTAWMPVCVVLHCILTDLRLKFSIKWTITLLGTWGIVT